MDAAIYERQGVGGSMKLDHSVVNVDNKYQTDKTIIDLIRAKGFPYEPKWGKRTRGFIVSNLWIGNEYFEMVQILKSDGGGWVEEWTRKYNQGHRGLICLMLDVEDIDGTYHSLSRNGLQLTRPKWLEFRWFFNLLTRRMPWRNCYTPFFKGVPLQIGFQEMKDEKSREFMNQYMVPNSRDNGIHGISRVMIKGPFTENDFDMISMIFDGILSKKEGSIEVKLTSTQFIEFAVNVSYQVEVYADSNKGDFIEIENIKIHC